MSFADALKADAVAIASSDEFGESLTYRPSVGAALTGRKCIVNRHPAALNEAGQKASKNLVFEVAIPKTTAEGVASIGVGIDTIDIPRNRGEAAIEFRVIEILHEDLGRWVLKVRR